ncbi:hypothetical protein JVU11DRAFT_1948 [Chiua virens]|nr:hypothetical protein JVU11DRAFT_1948 [Chiua virens]
MFEEYFGLLYPPQTFRRARTIWEYRENASLHARFIDYRQSEKATWAVFLIEAKRTS